MQRSVRRESSVTSPRQGRAVDISLPSLFVAGDHDLSSACIGTSYLLAAVPNATEARFPDCASSPSIEYPAEFTRLVRARRNENR